MATNPNDPINPLTTAEGEVNQNGMNKREEFAKAAMQGILANGATTTPSSVASEAVLNADALINELNV